jgi:peptidyl-prolyl isomerase G (cyclophilin G)
MMLDCFSSSKHVVFGQVVSGQPVVDMIENVQVDSNDSRPLKDIVISHCGQLVLVSSKTDKNLFFNRLVYLENNKEKKRKISTGEESENEPGSGSNASSSDEDKKKKKSKHKKKEKHRRKKEAKRLAKLTIEEENKPDQSTNDTVEKSNELSGRDMMGLKTTIDPDEIPEIPKHKFLMRHNLTDNNDNTR